MSVERLVTAAIVTTGEKTMENFFNLLLKRVAPLTSTWIRSLEIRRIRKKAICSTQRKIASASFQNWTPILRMAIDKKKTNSTSIKTRACTSVKQVIWRSGKLDKVKKASERIKRTPTFLISNAVSVVRYGKAVIRKAPKARLTLSPLNPPKMSSSEIFRKVSSLRKHWKSGKKSKPKTVNWKIGTDIGWLPAPDWAAWPYKAPWRFSQWTWNGFFDYWMCAGKLRNNKGGKKESESS